MKTILELQNRASELTQKHMADSIQPKDVGGLFEDSLAYVATMEQNLKNLGIRKTYHSDEEMQADVEPLDFQGRPIRFGQLVSLFIEADNVNDIYAYQSPGWIKIGRIAQDVEALALAQSAIKTAQETKEVIATESTARQAEDSRLDRRVSLLVKQMTSVQTMLDSETTAREEADEQLRKLIEAIDVNGGGGGSGGGEDVPSLEAYVIGEVLFLK